MGVDLTLLPIFLPDNCSRCFSHSVIECNRRRELFEKIMKIEKQKGRDVREDFSTFLCREKDEKTGFDDSHYGITTTTPYGDKLKYLKAGDLTEFENDEDVKDNFLNKAVWAYLKELPKDTKIALMWH